MPNKIRQWALQDAKAIGEQPFFQLLYEAQKIHRRHFNPNEIQISTLCSIKTGGCSEDCAYCPQSAHYETGQQNRSRLDIDEVISLAHNAKKQGATRFCMGAAWKSPHSKELATICEMVSKIKSLGLETCVTLGELNDAQAQQLKQAGLDFYNHNIDSSPTFFKKIITTHTFQGRLSTLTCVAKAGIKICCGGILGMGETQDDRIDMLVILANLSPQPDSIPINKLIKIPGTPLEKSPEIDLFDFIRIIALARILLPKAYIRLSAGREKMTDIFQAFCFLAGANSIFYGEKLLTTANASMQSDDMLLKRLGLQKIISNH